IERVPQDDDFRQSCYRSQNLTELMSLLEREGYKFSDDEFENACNMLHMKCADESAAYALHEIKSWFLILSLR
ncbi:MAG: hypothetical protein SNI57_04970, partial [Rikenellaceae bacterium]